MFDYGFICVVVFSCVIVFVNFFIFICRDFIYFMVLLSMFDVLVVFFMFGIRFWSFFMCLLICVWCICLVMFLGWVVYLCFVWVCIWMYWLLEFWFVGLFVGVGKFMWWIRLLDWLFNWKDLEFFVDLLDVLFFFGNFFGFFLFEVLGFVG